MENINPRQLKGAQKQTWLRKNRDYILQYTAQHGRGAAMLKFNISHPNTLDRLIGREPESDDPANKGEVERARLIAQTAIESARDVRGEVRQLKEAYQAFVEQVGEDLTKKLFLPLLRLCIRMDNPIFAPPPGVNLDDLFGDGQTEEQRGESPNTLVNIWVELSYRYEEALDSEDWKLALYYYYHLKEIEPALPS